MNAVHVLVMWIVAILIGGYFGYLAGRQIKKTTRKSEDAQKLEDLVGQFQMLKEQFRHEMKNGGLIHEKTSREGAAIESCRIAKSDKVKTTEAELRSVLNQINFLDRGRAMELAMSMISG